MMIRDVINGQEIDREATPDEIAELETLQAEKQSEQERAAAATEAAAQARNAAIAHAKSLGFTNEMIAVMYPNLAQPEAETV